jgi:cytochrome c-type protein NapC
MASSRAKTLVAALIIFAAGIGFAALFNTGVTYTNEMEFCTSCHSMQVNLEEYKQTIHYKNPSGVQATCSDCHVPKEFFPKLVAKIMAAKDVYHEILGTIDTPEKYEAHRWGMASAVWAKMKSSNSRECLSCHRLENMDLAAQATRSARSKHGNALDDGKTCIDCHKGVAHELPDEPDVAPDSAAAAEEGGAK